MQLKALSQELAVSAFGNESLVFSICFLEPLKALLPTCVLLPERN